MSTWPSGISPNHRRVMFGPDARSPRYVFEIAQQVGDLTYAAISCNNLLTQLLASGAPLAEVQREAETGLDFARRSRFALVGSLITAQLRLVRTLRGLTPAFGCFNDDGFDEQQFERRLEGEPSRGIVAWIYWIRKLQARFLADDYAAAIAAAAKAERLLWMSPAIFERADYHFYAALALIALCEAASDAESRPNTERPWPSTTVSSRRGPNIARRTLQAAPRCIGAEIARTGGPRTRCRTSVRSRPYARPAPTRLLHEEALANELAARFYLARGFEDIARALSAQCPLVLPALGR